MADIQVDAGSELAQSIQTAVQAKMIENGWVSEENDTTLSEYVTMMLANGQSIQQVTAELAGDLLGVSGDDPAVHEFSQWLPEQVRLLSGPSQVAMPENVDMQQEQETQPESQAQDSQMDDAGATDGAPSGPKAMRNGGGGAGRGRGQRMLGQLNNHLNRDQLPDPLRRIKGAAGGQHGRINAHAGRDPPRGPKGQNVAQGVSRMMGGAGRGGRGGHAGALNPMMQQNQMMSQMDPQQQMALMQMMEMQATMMQQMLQQNGQVPGLGQQNGAGGKSLFDRVDRKSNGAFKGRQQQRPTDSQNGNAASSMDLDSEGNRKPPFDTVCRFNLSCTNPSCAFAHQSPSAPPGQTMDLTDTCSYGAACENKKCAGRHPSPAQRTQHLKQEVDCKFYPNCTNPSCPFRHPDMPLCRNGADCNVAGCKFTHSKIVCRYTPCTKPFCPFKHAEGQKGVFKDKVWTAGSDGVPNMNGEGHGEMGSRFEGFKNTEGEAEELILPGQAQEDGLGGASQLGHETQILT